MFFDSLVVVTHWNNRVGMQGSFKFQQTVFDNKQMIPTWSVLVFRAFEWLIKPFAKWLAFRCYVVIEKV